MCMFTLVWMPFLLVLKRKHLHTVPSIPNGLQVTSNSSDALRFTWKPPSQPNGNVTHYIVAGKKHKNAMIDDLNERDYCSSCK